MIWRASLPWACALADSRPFASALSGVLVTLLCLPQMPTARGEEEAQVVLFDAAGFCRHIALSGGRFDCGSP